MGFLLLLMSCGIANSSTGPLYLSPIRREWDRRYFFKSTFRYQATHSSVGCGIAFYFRYLFLKWPT